MRCSWSPLRPSGPLRWLSAPCSVTATNPGASVHASWTSSKRSVSDESSNHNRAASPAWLNWPLLFFNLTANVFLSVSQALGHSNFLSNAAVANKKFTQTVCQIVSMWYVTLWVSPDRPCLAAESTQHENIRCLSTYELKACGLVWLSDWMPTDRNEAFDAWVFWSLKS